MLSVAYPLSLIRTKSKQMQPRAIVQVSVSVVCVRGTHLDGASGAE